jgi:sialic acid synthase SpsE
VVKGALIHDAGICFDGPVEAAYHDPASGTVRERYRDVIARHVLPLADAARIYRRAADLGLEIVLTAYDEAGVDFAVGCGAAAIKVASSNVTHARLIRHIARQGRPVIIDTGRATRAEIDRAFAWAREAGATDLIVQHSPPAPPAPVDQHHLRMMPALGRSLGCLYGLSDHHAGNEMLLAAVALGAAVVEKGVCADDAAIDIDIAHAARISEVPAIVARIGIVWRALGAEARELDPARPRAADRMGVVAARALRPGERITAGSVRFAMALPADAIGAESWDDIEGAGVAREVAMGSPLRWEDLAARD